MSPSIQDWAAKCATRIDEEFVTAKHRPSPERIAAIIATFAEPLMNLLRESKREHLHEQDTVGRSYCCPQCTCQSWPDDPEGDFEPTPNSDEPCTCGADTWNAKVDRVLNG